MASKRRSRTEGLWAKQNISVTLRSRGKIVGRREGHNIFVNLGREWLPQMISYASYGPDTLARNDGVKYMGLGIGGTRQFDLATVGAAPFSTHYPGTNAQDDVTPTVTILERPVRLTSPIPAAPVLPPYDPGDVWLGQVPAPPDYPTPTSVKYTLLVLETEISYGPFLSVPLSECGLLTSANNPNLPPGYPLTPSSNTVIAYDTFDTLHKTSAISLEITWTLRF